MTSPKLDTFRAMVTKHPRHALARFGLANELLKAELYEEAVEQLQAYLELQEDEGNAYGRLAEALTKNGFEVAKAQVRLPNGPLKTVGEHAVSIAAHTDVVVDVTVQVVAEQD